MSSLPSATSSQSQALQKIRGAPTAVAMEVVSDDDSAYFNSVPCGFRFSPHDDELIHSYLQKKIMKQELPRNHIPEVELYKHEPDYLTDKYPPHGEKEWYFFTSRDRKYKNGNRPNRAAGRGYWKATGSDKEIRRAKNGDGVGYRKALVFYYGNAPNGEKTNWIMHEFRVKQSDTTPPISRGPNDMKLDDWVLCKIYWKQDKSPGEDNNAEYQEEDVDIQIENGDGSDGYENSVPVNAPSNSNFPQMAYSYSNEMDGYMGNSNFPEMDDKMDGYMGNSNFPEMTYSSSDRMDGYMGNSNFPKMAYSYIDEMDGYMDSLGSLINLPNVDEYNNSLQYNLTPLPSESYHPLPHKFSDKPNIINGYGDSISLIEPISTKPPMQFTEVYEQENYSFFPEFDFVNTNYVNGFNF